MYLLATNVEWIPEQLQLRWSRITASRCQAKLIQEYHMDGWTYIGSYRPVLDLENQGHAEEQNMLHIGGAGQNVAFYLIVSR